MSRRLVSPAMAGCLLVLASLPVFAQRGGWVDWVIVDDLPAAPTESTPTESRPPAVVTPAPARPAVKKLPAQVWKTLAPFKSASEFDEFRRKARDIARTHGWSWGFLRQRRNDGPLLAQEATEEPCDPGLQECAGESLDEVMATGIRASRPTSITNNQVAGVDEGDIVKAYDRFLVVLMHGRLFSVDTGAATGNLRLVDRVDTYQDAKDESWIDEILIYKDTVLVTGYSYETDASNIALYRIDEQGRFRFLARYFIESEDYYSWENYATRIVDGKLVIYTPFDLSEYDVEAPMPLPRIRRFTEPRGFSEWRPLFDAESIYRPIQPAIHPALHVMSVCPIDPAAELQCEARGIVGPHDHEMYVAPDHAYLWLTTDRDELAAPEVDDCEPGQNVFRQRGSPSAVYRMTVSRGRLAAVHTEGRPADQFALEEKGSSFWALVRRPPLACNAIDEEGIDYEPLALLQVHASEFSTRPPRLTWSSYHDMPRVSNDWSLQTRFAEGHVLYGGDGERYVRGGGYVQEEDQLIVVPLSQPARKRILTMRHGVDRVELFGENAVVFGSTNEDEDLAVSSVKLASRPRIVDTRVLAGASESEGRSHAFNAIATERGDGLMGLPIEYQEESSRSSGETPTHVQFFAADRELRLHDAARLSATPEAELDPNNPYECHISCYEWYGNSRPIFYRDRIFALIGHEVIEGTYMGGRVTESARLDLTSMPAYPR
jgi:hypothetical protein